MSPVAMAGAGRLSATLPDGGGAHESRVPIGRGRQPGGAWVLASGRLRMRKRVARGPYGRVGNAGIKQEAGREWMMKCNVGTVDRVVRILVALAMGYLGFFENPLLSDELSQLVVGVAALIPLFTGLTRFCPLYAMVGISSR